MKNSLILVIFFIVSFNLYSQDFIILKNSDTIKCKIMEDKIAFLTYVINSIDTTILSIKADEFDFYIKTDNIFSVNSNQINTINNLKYKINIKNLKKGAYLDFEEFINNNPSIDFKFNVNMRSDFDISMMGGNRFKVEILENSMESSRVKNEFWGICDGKDCYINCFLLSQNKYYSQLLLKGDYAFFYAKPSKDERMDSYKAGLMLGGAVGGAVGGAIAGASAALDCNLYRLDFKTGSIKKK